MLKDEHAWQQLRRTAGLKRSRLSSRWRGTMSKVHPLPGVSAIYLGHCGLRLRSLRLNLRGQLVQVSNVRGGGMLPARNRTLFEYNQAYGSTSQALNPTIKANIFHAEGERDEYVSRRLYLFGNAAFDHNFSQGPDLQQRYGGGLGYTLLKSSAQELDVKWDVHYAKQQFFSPSSNLNLFGSTFAEAYRRTLPHALCSISSHPSLRRGMSQMRIQLVSERLSPSGISWLLIQHRRH